MVPDALLAGGAADVIWFTIGGKTFRCGRRTAAHLYRTFDRFEHAFPELRLLIRQGCYNDTVEASKGTHDKDGVIDFDIVKKNGGLATEDDYWHVQRWLRNQGWAAWFRHLGTWASRGAWHIHSISLGCPGPLGEFVDGGLSTTGRIYTSSQIADYYKHTYGLKDQHTQDADKSAFPGDRGSPPWPVGTEAQWKTAINQTIFDYPAWKDEHEMNDAQDQLLKQIAKDTTALRAYNERETAREKRRHAAIMGALDELANDVSDDATKTQVARARKTILAALQDDTAADQSPVV